MRPSIFETLGALDNSSKMTLSSFLEMMNFFDNDSALRNHPAFIRFKNLYTEGEECFITGSSVLHSRLNTGKFSGDVDLFIDDTPENKDIIQSFFNDDILMTAFAKHLGLSKKYRDFEYKITSNENYIFKKSDFILTTSRFNFGPETDQFHRLNFIFVGTVADQTETISDSSRRCNANPEEVNAMRFSYQTLFSNDIYFGQGIAPIFFNALPRHVISQTLPSITENFIEAIMQDVHDNFPRSLALHCIDAAFDFEELKYVYSPVLNQAVTTKMQAKLIMQHTDEKFKTMEFSERVRNKTSPEHREQFINVVRKNISRYIERLDKEHKRFIQKFSKPEVLSMALSDLSPSDLSIIKSLARHSFEYNPKGLLSGDTGSNHQHAEMFKKITETLVQRQARLNKYRELGFKIEDPDLILSGSALAVDALLQSILGDTELVQDGIKKLLFEKDAYITRDTIKNSVRLEALSSENKKLRQKYKEERESKATSERSTIVSL